MSADSKPKDFGYDTSSHHLLLTKQPPPSIIELRNELPYHATLYSRASKGADFSECLAEIAADCDIVLDGEYTPGDIAKICEICVDVLRSRRLSGVYMSQIHKYSDALINCELTERPDGVSIDEVKDAEGVQVASKKFVPYTVCDKCRTSYDCCENRSCGLEKPANQRKGRN